MTFAPRYLEAKKSVDDRALNAYVWQMMANTIRQEKIQRVIEVGAGIGTMAERLVARGVMGEGVEYTAVDNLPESVATAKKNLQNSPLQLTFETADIFEFIKRKAGHQTWDLMIAHAFLDLLDVPVALPKLLSLVRPRGCFYFTINFDGVTILQPTIDQKYDDYLMQLYHQTMDERVTEGKLSGDSRSGRHLFGYLRDAGAQILAAGSSDWVVFAGADGYPADEAYFLQVMLGFMEGSLGEREEVDNGRFTQWLTTRHAQIDSGDLVLIAHQIDFFGVCP